MGEYWSTFALYWGWRICFFTFVEVAEAFQSGGVSVRNCEAESLFESLMKKFSEPGITPIITAREMNLHIPADKRHLYINLG